MGSRGRILFFAILCSLSSLVGCTTVGESGRKQLMLIPESRERQMGEEAWQLMERSLQPSPNSKAAELVERVGRRVAIVTGKTDYEWEFRLFESPAVNAFCLPGGKVAVYTGILGPMESEAGMAVVLGHECAHATCRHGAERISEQMAVRTVGSIVSGAARQWVPNFQGLINTGYNFGMTGGIILPFYRAHEEEADHVGLLYAARAGYDPEEAIRFWERMTEAGKKAGRGHPPAFLSTHPTDEKRIAKLREYLPEAQSIYAASSQQFGRGAPLPLGAPQIARVE